MIVESDGELDGKPHLRGKDLLYIPTQERFSGLIGLRVDAQRVAEVAKLVVINTRYKGCEDLSLIHGFCFWG